MSSQPKPLSVGMAKLDITPSTSIRLTGYGNRSIESEGVEQKIWAKAFAFGTDKEGPSLLISVDLLGIPAYFGENLAQKLSHTFPIQRSRIAICATHTHSAPAIGGVAPLIFAKLAPHEMGKIAAYTVFLEQQLAKVAEEALNNRKPALLHWAKGSAGFATNRRVLSGGKVDFGANYEGPVDHDMPLMRITDPQGNLLGLIVNYACHCTTLTGSYNKIHGDWAGVACEHLEEEYPGSITMVTIGCGADADPQPRGKMSDVLKNAEFITDEVKRLLKGNMEPIKKIPKPKLSYVDLQFAHIPTTDELLERGIQSDWKDAYAKKNLELLSQGGKIPSQISYPIQVWPFGKELAMVFLGGEVVVDYALRLKKELDSKRLWINAYANDVPCYIASRRIIKEGGYEAEGSMYYYNKPSAFKPEIEDIIINKVKALMPKAFAP